MLTQINDQFDDFSSDSSSTIDNYLNSIRRHRPIQPSEATVPKYVTENKKYPNDSNIHHTSNFRDSSISKRNKLDIDVHYDGICSDVINSNSNQNLRKHTAFSKDDSFNLANPPQNHKFIFTKHKPIVITSEELKQPNQIKTNSPKQSKHKKKSKANLNHSIYQTKPSPKSKIESNNQPKTIKKPKKEINEMVQRLSKPPQRQSAQNNQNQPKKLTSNALFLRLYDMSTEKHNKIEEMRQLELQKEIEEDLINRNSIKSTQKSIELADKKVQRFIDLCFKDLGNNTKDSLIQPNQIQLTNENQNKIDFNDTQIHQTDISNNENELNNDQNNISNTSELNSEVDQFFCISNNILVKREIGQAELIALLLKLGLITSKNEQLHPILISKLNDWILNKNKQTFDLKRIYEDIAKSIESTNLHLSQFYKFCKKRILILISNLKNFENESAVNKSNQNNFCSKSNENKKSTPNDSKIRSLNSQRKNCLKENKGNQSSSFDNYKSFTSTNEFASNQQGCPSNNQKDSNSLNQANFENSKSKIRSNCNETILRLSKSRYKPEINQSKTEDPFPIRKRDVFKMNPYSEELERPKKSKKTKEIYQQEIAKISFHDRESILLEKRKLKLKQIEEENSIPISSQKYANEPKFSPETRQQLNEYKERKKEIKVEEENTYRPTVIDYELFKKNIFKEMIENKERPEGYYSDISRHRMAYHKYLDEKKEKEKEEDLDYIYSKY